MNDTKTALIDKGFAPSAQKGVLLERVAETVEKYRHRGSVKSRVLYCADFITAINADGTVDGFSPSNFRDTRRFRGASIDTL